LKTWAEFSISFFQKVETNIFGKKSFGRGVKIFERDAAEVYNYFENIFNFINFP
jgi:hypothetical protein